MKTTEMIRSQELTELCIHARELVSCQKYEECNDLVCQAMVTWPSAPQPHNLLGVLLEKTGNHALAMKHFRAAWALDPTYGPANQNLSAYGTFYSRGRAAFDESDCLEREDSKCDIEYDSHGIGHIIRRRSL